MDGTAPRTGVFSSYLQHPLVRAVLYYVALAIGLLALRSVAPDFWHFLSSGELPQGADLGEAVKSVKQGAQLAPGDYSPGVMVFISMSATFVLMLPVVWIYTFTRQKRGYQQSLVQTLVMLPVVVASVIILVKSSVALAFSLGGVVGAVSFRNRLEDTKDAIYVFLSIAVGLACGSQVIEIGLALTLFFNLIIIILWYSDFGRVPAQLQGSVAQKRIDKARVIAGVDGKKTAELVNAIDQQILMSMTPDQLEHLAAQALKRQKKMSSELYDTDKEVEKKEEPEFETLRITVTEGGSADTVRELVEKVLAQDAKEWAFEQAGMGNGRTTLEYRVRCKKSVPRPILLEMVRRSVPTQAEQVHFL